MKNLPSKEIILKYLTEFNAWVKGQEVYVMFNNGGHRLVDSLEDFNKDVKYIVLRDSYFPCRTALAEGRQFQFFNTKERLYDSSKPLHTWQDTNTIRTHGIPSDYRIKPEPIKGKIVERVGK